MAEGPWRWTTRPLASGTEAVRVVDAHDRDASFAQVLRGLEESRDFRSLVVEGLAAAPWRAFFFEVAPITTTAATRAFAAVLVEAPELAEARPDAAAFAAHFEATEGAPVVAFPSLGRDAHLVVPTPRGPLEAYAHLAAFVRGAPGDQVDALLRTLGQMARARVSSAPLWVSTAGLGVSWLHFRLDSRPKYYRHAAFHAPPSERS